MRRMSATASPRKVLICPPGKGISIPWREIIDYRDVLYFLVWRDIKIRYKETFLGIGWVVVQPLVSMTIFSILFGRFARLPSEGIPYPLFTLAALVPWQFFAYALHQVGHSVVANQALVTRVYFPRLLVPLSALLSGILDFFISFGLLIGAMFCYGVFPGWKALLLPVALLFPILPALGVGLWLTSLMVRYRDIRYVIPFLTQVWFYVTPVAYSATLIPERWRIWAAVNPLTGVVEFFRWMLLRQGQAPLGGILLSILVGVIVLLTGLWLFQKLETEFSDIL